MYEKEVEAQSSQINAQRLIQIGTKGRSEKIRTYNFNQDRITDHRIGKNMFNIESYMIGGEQLNEMIESLQEESAKERLIEKLTELDRSKGESPRSKKS